MKEDNQYFQLKMDIVFFGINFNKVDLIFLKEIDNYNWFG